MNVICVGYVPAWILQKNQPADSAAAKTGKAASRARFVAYELPADFVANLRQRAA